MDTRIPIDILDNSDVVTKNNIDEVINDFTGATSGGNGVRGFVPAPQKGSQNGFLKGDGTWTTAGVVDQSISTSNNDYPILLGPTAGASTSQGNKSAIFASNVKVNPSTGEVTATSFNGAVTGNADTATSLASNFTIKLTGDVSGSTTTNGTGTASITATVADDSHNHIISNVDGLQDALDGKAPLQHTHAAADVTSGEFDAARIPGLDGSKITTGTIALERLPEEARPRHSHGNISQNGTLTNASAVVITDANGAIDSSSTISTTELGYLNNVTSNIQDQLDAKAADSSVVHNTGNESISGVKTFSDGISVSTVSGDGSGLTSLNASQITTGTIDIARLPSGALERLVIVDDLAARFALTTDDVQLGDTVKQADTGVMYYVKDIDHLDSAAGYEPYSAGSATSVPWSGVTSKPTEYNPTSHASSATTYGISTDALYGHAMASSTTPKVAGTAAVGSETAKFARGDHVHPAQTSVSGNAGTATKFASNQTVALTGDVTGSASSQAGWSIATTLADSGVTAGTIGNNSQQTPSHGGTFNIPYVTVDSKGRVTAGGTTTVKLPSDNNTDTLVTQNVSTANEEHPILLTVTKDASANQGAKTSIFAAAVKVNPSTGTVTATKFSGAVSGNADTATKFASAQSVALTGDVTGSASSQAGWSVATTLANSGVTAGSYGPSDNATPGYGATFNVPYITVDAKGRVTAASTKTVKIPASDDTNNKVTQTVSTDNSELPILAKASNATSTVTDTSKFAAAVKLNPSTGTVTATKFVGPLTGNVTGNVSGNAGTATKQSSTISDGNYADVVNVTDGTNRVGTIRITNNDGSTSMLLGVHNESNGAPAGLTITNTDGVLTANFPGTLTATSITGNASSATQFASNQSVTLTGDVTGTASSKAGWSVATTLANSGVTAGTYGNTSQQTPSHGGTFNIPYYTVDAKGRVTAGGTTTVKLPSDNNTDTLMTQNVSTTNATYPLLAVATADATANLGAKTGIFGAGVKINPSDSKLIANYFIADGMDGIRFRQAGSNKYTSFIRNDGSSTYWLLTNANDPDGTWNSFRPLTINNSTGACSISGNAATATKFASNQSVALTGDVTGSASSQAGWSIATTLKNSGVTAGTYNTVTVNAKGIATAGSNVSYCMHVDTLPSSVPTGLVDGGILIVG